MSPPAPSSDRALPVLIAVAGQLATGRRRLAQALAERIGAACIEAARARDELAARIDTELRQRAQAVLETRRSVVLEACLPGNLHRLEARGIARRNGAAFLFVACETEDVTGLAADETLRVRCDGTVAEVVAKILAAPCLRPPRADPSLPLARLRAVTFDCWNTLLYEADWKAAHALRVDELRAAAHAAGRDASRDAAERAFDVAWRRHVELWCEGVACGSREIALWGLLELGIPDPDAAAFAQLIQRFEEMSHTGRVLALDGAAETLAALERAGVACALVCDTGLTPGRVVRAHLEQHGLLRPLAAQVFSDEIGVPKPDPRAFRAALDALGVEPEAALHVGDLRRTDVVGARALGMTAVRIRDRHDDGSALVDADHVVGSHAELRTWLGLAAPPGGYGSGSDRTTR